MMAAAAMRPTDVHQGEDSHQNGRRFQCREKFHDVCLILSYIFSEMDGDEFGIASMESLWDQQQASNDERDSNNVQSKPAVE
jgi:hypothetical protein